MPNEPAAAASTPVPHQNDTGPHPDFPHWMLKEIYDQPQALQGCLAAYPGGSGRGTMGDRLPFLDEIQRVQILASGTSRHAGLIGQYWLEQWAGIPTRVRSGTEFLAAPWPVLPQTLTLGVTQSGETADTLKALAIARQRQVAQAGTGPFVGITNHPERSLAAFVDVVLPTYAGPEIGVAATKTFTTQLLVLYRLALELAYRRDRLSLAQVQTHLHQLQTLPAAIDQLLQHVEPIQALAQCLASAQHCLVLGQGVQHAIAQEGALKLKETTYLHAEGAAIGEFMHGPIALLDATVPVLAIAHGCPDPATFLGYLRKAKSHGAPLFALVPPDLAPSTHEICDLQIVLPAVDLARSPFLTVIPLQLLSYYIAVLRGLDVDRPRNITKTLS